MAKKDESFLIFLQSLFNTYPLSKVGMILHTLPPRGAFILPASLRPEQTFVFVAVGSGITPITIASIAGVHFRVLYVGQVTLSVFAIYWGFMTVLTFSKPGRFNVDVHIALDWGFFFYLLAFIISTIAGIISVRWAERMQQRDLVKSLKIP